MVYLLFMLVFVRVIVYFVFYGVFGVWVYLLFINVDLMFIYGYFGYMFLSVSCLFPTYATDSPPPPWKGVYTAFSVDFERVCRAMTRERHFC